MGRLRRRQKPLAARKPHCFGETLVLLVRPGLHNFLINEHAQRWGISVVAEPARVNPIGNEAVAQREHLRHRTHADGVPKVVGVDPACQSGTGSRLRGQETCLGLLPRQLVTDERVCQAGKIGAAADAPDHHIRVRAGHLHLLLGFEADHCLVQENVVDDRTERVLGIVVGGGVLDGFGDRDPEAAWRVRVVL